MSRDDTKELLEKLLADLYEEQAVDPVATGDSFLRGADGQFLGRLTQNAYDTDSLLNQYGPYGSPYSPTSIFNEYSPYGSPYGQFSVRNPYTTNAPELVVGGHRLGQVTVNTYVPDQIPTDAFLYSLKNELPALLRGQVGASESAARKQRGDSFLRSADGKFLGSIKPNRYDQESIFNRYGPYGNRYSPDSIFNRYGPYGGRFAASSAYNPYSTTPPQVFLNGQFHGYLTKSKVLRPKIDPDDLLEWAKRNVSR